MTTQRRATLHDVAKRAGTSHTTVARVLHGDTSVKASTANRVNEALQDLDYHTNVSAQALASHRRAARTREAAPDPQSGEVDRLSDENRRLRDEVASLRRQLLSLTG
jgi:LacI family transcriptional regulator